MEKAPQILDPKRGPNRASNSPELTRIVDTAVFFRLTLGLLALLGQLVLGAGGCAGRTAAGGANGAVSPPADAQAGVSVPFSLCRGFGVAGTPCYPTNVDIGSRFISPCRERLRGHCELSGPRQTMACLLAPVPDGKPCAETGVCKDGTCVKE